MTQWTSEMLDNLATRVDDLTATVNKLAETTAEQAALSEDRDQRMELIMIAVNSLVETSIDYSRWKVETDQRFNILLEEVRSVNRRVTILENQ